MHSPMQMTVANAGSIPAGGEIFVWVRGPAPLPWLPAAGAGVAGEAPAGVLLRAAETVEIDVAVDDDVRLSVDCGAVAVGEGIGLDANIVVGEGVSLIFGCDVGVGAAVGDGAGRATGIEVGAATGDSVGLDYIYLTSALPSGEVSAM
jgi:hypothetical protein